MRYVLGLNPVTGRLEAVELVAWSADRESLVRWMLEQRHLDADGNPSFWTDGQFFKRFRQGSALEWFNLPDERAFDARSDAPYAANCHGHGVQEHLDEDDYLERTRERYREFFAGLPDVGTVVPIEERVARLVMEGEEPA